MLRRILAAVIIVIGLALIGLGVASATVWRPADHITVSTDSSSAPLTLVLPGVLGLVDENVTLTATAESEQPIILAFGPASEVMAWVGNADHLQVQGLADWENLALENVQGEEETVPDPRTSLLWTDVIEGTGEISLQLTADSSQVILLAATDGTEPAPTLTLTWPLEVETPYMVPLIAAGSVLALIGLAWLAYQLLVARELRERETAQEEIEQKVERQRLETQIFRSDQPMTRRQLREMQRRFKDSDPRHAEGGPVAVTAGAVGAGVLPGVSDPGKFRALRHIPVDDSVELPIVREAILTEPIVAESPEPAEVDATTEAPQSAEAPEPIETLEPTEHAADPTDTADTAETGVGQEALETSEPAEETPPRTSWRSLWDIKEDDK